MPSSGQECNQRPAREAAGISTQFFVVDSSIKDLAERLPIFIYLWGKLDVLDLNARIKRFHAAAEANEVKVLAAMLQHPEGPMIDEEWRQRILTERAKKFFPRDYEAYEQNAILLEFLVMARNWIGGWLYREITVEISVIRENFGDIADALSGQRLENAPAFVGA